MNHTNNLLTSLTNKDLQMCHKKLFEKGQIIFKEGDLCSEIGIVVKGLIEIVSYSTRGTSTTYNIISSGDMFGNNLVFAENEFYKGNVICKTQTELILISKKNLINILMTNKSFLEEFLYYNANFSIDLNNKIKILSINTVRDRILYLFGNNKTMKINSVSDLAKKIFVSRESASREISKMVKEKVLARKANTLTII